MKKKSSLKEQDETKVTLENCMSGEDRSPAAAAAAPHRAAVEERMVSFNLGDLEEVPERERLPRVEMKETSIDGGESHSVTWQQGGRMSKFQKRGWLPRAPCLRDPLCLQEPCIFPTEASFSSAIR